MSASVRVVSMWPRCESVMHICIYARTISENNDGQADRQTIPKDARTDGINRTYITDGSDGQMDQPN